MRVEKKTIWELENNRTKWKCRVATIERHMGGDAQSFKKRTDTGCGKHKACVHVFKRSTESPK